MLDLSNISGSYWWSQVHYGPTQPNFPVVHNGPGYSDPHQERNSHNAASMFSIIGQFHYRNVFNTLAARDMLIRSLLG